MVDTFTAAGKPGAMTFYGLGSYGVMAAIALVLSTAMGVIGTPTHRTRIYTSKDEKTARKAFLGRASCCSLELCYRYHRHELLHHRHHEW